jgi:Mce-associated membrane protein
VEDQPADSGDLTNAESPAPPADQADATDAKPSRRRHRMPLRSELAAGRDDTAAGDDDQRRTDESPEPTTDGAVEDQPVTRKRRWSLFGRRTKSPEPEAAPANDDVEEPPRPMARVPVGKASRTARPTGGPGSTVDDETTTADVEAQESSDDADDVAADEQIPVPQILVAHRPAGKRLTTAAAAAAAVFVAAAAFSASMLQPYLADRALVHTKVDIARTAASAITTLWTYTPDNMDQLPDRAAGYLGGDFANEYRKYIDAIVAPNKQAQVTNNTQVMGTAVESVTPTEATALVYTNSVATSPGSKNIPSLRYLSYRLTMQRHDAKWLITRMSTVTSFDLTPQL